MTIPTVMELNRKQVLIFDFDGTLADTSPLHEAAFSRTLAPLNVPFNYNLLAGLKTSDAIEECLASANLPYSREDITALVETKQRTVRELIKNDLVPIPGVDGFLRMARRFYRFAIVSSGSRGTVGLALKQLGYLDWFELIVCAEDVEQGKPNPEGFNFALKRLCVDPLEALVFEDSAAGLMAADAANIDAVDVTKMNWASIESVFSTLNTDRSLM